MRPEESGRGTQECVRHVILSATNWADRMGLEEPSSLCAGNADHGLRHPRQYRSMPLWPTRRNWFARAPLIYLPSSRRGLETGLSWGVHSASASSTKWILVAGPYRSGTGDDPELLARNVAFMESFALPIFRAGHVPVVGEWLALPLVHAAGSRRVGDDAFNGIFHPIAIRLLDKCDGVLRVGGPSTGADEMVRIARERGLDIYLALDEIPGCSAAAADSSR
jgi:hypothetical protein